MANKINLNDPYFNEYKDRGIQKWLGFFLSEHTAQIAAIEKAEAVLPRLPQQSEQEIEFYLERSIKHNKVLEIQLNTLNHLGNPKPHVFGTFRGMADLETAMIGDQYIPFDDIRHVKIHNFLKWSDMSDITPDEQPFGDMPVDGEVQEFCEDYFNDDWIE